MLLPVDKGRVTLDELPENERRMWAWIEHDIGWEVHDVLCTAECPERKPVSADIHNPARWRRLRKSHPEETTAKIARVNEAYRKAYDAGVRCIFNKVETRGYNSFYYNEKDPNGQRNALKLLAMWSHHPKVSHLSWAQFHFCSGTLLGYSRPNIDHFLRTRGPFDGMTPEWVEATLRVLEGIDITLDEFDGEWVYVPKKPRQIALKSGRKL